MGRPICLYFLNSSLVSAIRCELLGELEVNQAGAAAVQASAYTDKIRRDDDEAERPFAHSEKSQKQ
jgi:hypothetical protein